MARYTGKDLLIEWITTGGTTDLSGDFRSFSVSEQQDAADSTAGDDTYKGYIPTFADATAELEMLDTKGTAGTPQWAGVAPGTEGTVRWSPGGTAAGQIKRYAPAFISGRDSEFPYDDVVKLTVGFQLTAAPTNAAYT